VLKGSTSEVTWRPAAKCLVCNGYMIKQFVVYKRLKLVLAVLATLFIANMEIALDQHDLGCLPLNVCPVCASAHLLSAAEHFSNIVPGVTDSCPVVIPGADVKSFTQNQDCLPHLQNRAPPSKIIG
jgi:hypothetical protein